MATIEEKIQSVKSGSASSNPYDQFITQSNQIVPALNAITLVNNGDPNDGTTTPLVKSTFELIEDAWNGWTEVDPVSGDVTVHSGWITDVAGVLTHVTTLNNNMSAHYSAFWDGETMNYKNRPALLNGIRQVRINVAIEDGGGDSLTEAEKEAIADAQHNDLDVGTSTFIPSSVDELNLIYEEITTMISAFNNVVTAITEQDIIDARADLPPINAKIDLIGSKFDTWKGMESAQHDDSMAYAVAYGATMFAEGNPGSNAVDSLMGGLP